MMKFFILNILFTLFARDYALFVCEGDGFFPDPYDCVKFYRCHSGQVFEFSCGPGTHFNPNHNGCDWPSAVGCQPLVPESQAQPSGYNQQYNQQHNRQPNQQSSHRHHSHQNHRQPEESVQTDSRYQSPQTGYQNPYDNTYEQQNRGYDRRQQRYPETDDTTEYSGNSDTNYGNRENIGTNNRQVDNRNKVRPQPKPYPENRRTDNRFTDEDNFDHHFDERVTESVNRERQPNKQKARPKPKSQQYPEHRITDQNYGYPENTDNNYDGITGRQKDRVRPQQRPYVEDNQPIDYGRQQETDENDWQTRRTTSRYRAPPARNRIRTTIRTTEDPNSNEEEEEDEFSQLFQNELRKDSEEPTDSNNWFDFNAFDDQDIESTTEDLFVSMLKSKVPVIQNNLDSHKNRSRIDKNRKHGSQPVSTLAPIRSRMRTTPTLDPFKADWLAFNSGTNNRNNYNNKRPHDSIQSSAEANFKRKPFKDDPLLIPDLISYFNCSEAGKSCDTCQELDWIKYSGIGLQALPFRSFKFHSKIVSKQCYKACSESQQCIGFFLFTDIRDVSYL